MSTRNIVPRGNGEGSIGTSAKRWDAAFINKLNDSDMIDLTAWSAKKLRTPNTHYDAGELMLTDQLSTGLYLECITQGTTAATALTITGTVTPGTTTVTDGTVTWLVCKIADDADVQSKLNLTFDNVDYHKQTFSSSGSFTAPVTGMYKITLQGGGGQGGIYAYTTYTSGGGGSGAHIVTYRKIEKDTILSFTIGAGGANSTDGNGGGNPGGDSSITIDNDVFIAGGGLGGGASVVSGRAGAGGRATLNGVQVDEWSGFCGHNGQNGTGAGSGGLGGGPGGATWKDANSAVAGAGGAGASYISNTTVTNSNAGGDGYITFEWTTQPA